MAALFHFIRLLILLSMGLLTITALVLLINGPFAFETDPGSAKFSISIPGTYQDNYESWGWRLSMFAHRSLMVYTLYQLLGLFGQFAKKRYFSKKAVRHMRAFSLLYILHALGAFALEWAGTGSFTHGLAHGDFDVVTISTVLLIIAHIIGEAHKNEEELEAYF